MRIRIVTEGASINEVLTNPDEGRRPSVMTMYQICQRGGLDAPSVTSPIGAAPPPPLRG
jgi:hypothetical protein